MHARLRRIMPGAAPADWPNDAGLVGPGRGPGSRAFAGLDYRCTTMRGGGCGLWSIYPAKAAGIFAICQRHSGTTRVESGRILRMPVVPLNLRMGS